MPQPAASALLPLRPELAADVATELGRAVRYYSPRRAAGASGSGVKPAAAGGGAHWQLLLGAAAAAAAFVAVRVWARRSSRASSRTTTTTTTKGTPAVAQPSAWLPVDSAPTMVLAGGAGADGGLHPPAPDDADADFDLPTAPRFTRSTTDAAAASDAGVSGGRGRRGAARVTSDEEFLLVDECLSDTSPRRAS